MAWVFENARWEFPLYNIKGKQRLREERIPQSHASHGTQAACGLPAEILEFYANQPRYKPAQILIPMLARTQPSTRLLTCYASTCIVPST